MDGMLLIRARRGLIAEVARTIGVTPGAISQWRKVPAERVVEVERASGIPRHKLRPDLFDAPAQPAPAAPQAAA